MCMVCFIFFKQKTAYGMRISDWSSDVCSSDLAPSGRPFFLPATGSADRFGPAQGLERDRVGEGDPVEDRRGVVADLQHQAAHPTIDLGQAILAMLVRVAACAGHERERAAGQADEIRSEERRGGKEGVRTMRSRWRPFHEKKKKKQKR